MELNYKEIAQQAVSYAEGKNKTLDFSKKSIEEVDAILESYHTHLSEYEGEDGSNTIWNIAVHFGIYLGGDIIATATSGQRIGVVCLGYRRI